MIAVSAVKVLEEAGSLIGRDDGISILLIHPGEAGLLYWYRRIALLCIVCQMEQALIDVLEKILQAVNDEVFLSEEFLYSVTMC